MKPEVQFPWDEIIVDNLFLPSELICYYLYKYRSDLSKKKENKADIDLSYIKNYYEKLKGCDNHE